jgi:hypothetical protein
MLNILISEVFIGLEWLPKRFGIQSVLQPPPWRPLLSTALCPKLGFDIVGRHAEATTEILLPDGLFALLKLLALFRLLVGLKMLLVLSISALARHTIADRLYIILSQYFP